MFTQSQIENNFVYHSATHEQEVKYNVLRVQFKRLAEEINLICANSREKSLAMTNLEQAMFWANASIARNE